MTKKKMLTIILVLVVMSCGTMKKPVLHASQSYVLPSFRPGPDIERYLQEQLVAQPDNAIYHRDLGSLFQSRTSMVQPPERWELVREANYHLEIAYQSLKDDPQTLIFLGLAQAAKAKDPDVGVFAKLSTALKGFSLMDDAVAMDPDNFSLRLIRAKALLLAPSILGKGDLLLRDTAFIREQSLFNPNLPLHHKVLGLIFLGDYHNEINPEQAKDFWQQAADAGTAFTEEALNRMKGINIGF